jgi:tetratricopeptide (TPR) repeat protein
MRRLLAAALATACVLGAACAADPEGSGDAASFDQLMASGRRWQAASNPDAAERQFRQAQRLAASFEESDPRRVRADQALGEVYREQGRIAEARALLDPALARWRPFADRDPLLLADLLESLGLLSVMEGRLEPAQPLLAEALDLRRRELGPEAVETAEAMVNLAEVERLLGEYERAENHLLEAGAIYGAHGGRYALRIATIQTHLGLLYQEVGRFPDAEVQHHQAVQLARQVNDRDNPNLAIASRGLADLYARTGRTEQALVLYRWSLGVFERTLGPSHYETQITRSRVETLERAAALEASPGGGAPLP